MGFITNASFTLKTLFTVQRCFAHICGFCVRCTHSFIRIIGIVLAIAAILVILLLTYVFFFDIKPRLYYYYSPFTIFLLSIFGIYLAIQVTFHYISCTYTSRYNNVPPNIPIQIMELLRDDPDLYLSSLRLRTVGLEENRKHRYCSTCQSVKPMRTHHCSICDRCVLKMDHHCPWMNCCIGYANHRHFVLFLFYVVVGCSFVLIIEPNRFLDIIAGANNESLAFVLSVILSVAIAISAFIFLIWSFYLILTNQTTIEFYGNVYEQIDERGKKRKNHLYPYYMNPIKNLKTVFGNNIIKSFLLPIWIKPDTYGGVLYELNEPYKSRRREEEKQRLLQTNRQIEGSNLSSSPQPPQTVQLNQRQTSSGAAIN